MRNRHFGGCRDEHGKNDRNASKRRQRLRQRVLGNDAGSLVNNGSHSLSGTIIARLVPRVPCFIVAYATSEELFLDDSPLVRRRVLAE